MGHTGGLATLVGQTVRISAEGVGCGHTLQGCSLSTVDQGIIAGTQILLHPRIIGEYVL